MLMTDAQQKECLAVLLKADIFSAAGEMELASVLLDFSELRSFKKDEIIYSPQNPEKCIGVLIKGEARVTKDYVTMSVLHPGQQFGTVVLYHKTDYFVNTILAKTDCKVLFVNKEGVDRLLAHNRRFAVAYISYLSKRIYFLNEKIEAYTAPNAESKLLHYLKSVCDANGVVSGISITELSRQINVSRASLYRALDTLSASGKLRHDGKKIILL